MLPDGWQGQHLGSAEKTAGPRFDSILDVDLSFAATFDGFGRTRRYRDALVAVGNRLDAVFSHGVGDDAPDALRTLRDAALSTARLLAAAASSPPEALIDFDEIVAAARGGIEASWTLRDYRRDKKGEGGGTKVSDFVLHEANKAADLLGEAVELAESRSSRAANRRLLLITGSAGSGKTHLLLHVARERASSEAATIVLFGDRFSELAHIQEGGARQGLGRRYSLPEMLDELEEIGSATNTRSLLLIDAINETIPCGIWQEGLEWIEDALRTHPHVAVALSVRSGFEDAVAAQDLLDRILVVEHPGFAEDLWAAIRAFFSHYRVQWPEVPLLGLEFANPLFLKLFCLAYSGQRPQGVRGHAGGTGIFEDYAKKVGPVMNRELGQADASSDLVWKQLIKPIAAWMGENGVEEIPVDDAKAIAEMAYPGRGLDALTSAESHALVMKSPRFSRDGEITHYVFRFSYQKFSDHLIVRFLLNSHFDSLTPKEAFRSDTRLGRIASLKAGRGLLEALAAQIPERTNGEWELPNLAPEDVAESWQMCGAFLDSLVWRKPEALGQRAIDYINTVIVKSSRLEDELFEVLLSVASIPGYRLNARALHRHLASWPLHVRDQVWTRWLRYQYSNDDSDGGTSVDRLLIWARWAPGREHVSMEAALLTCIALSWLLVTPNRFLRDDATKSVVALLCHHPAVIPKLLELFDAVNDPYVVERVYCAALGALMRNPDGDALIDSSKVLLGGFFSRRDSTHILTRDYARGVVELAVKYGLLDESEAAPARPPYGSIFPEAVPSKAELKAKYSDSDGYVREYGSIWHSVMDWDFGWYIIGTNSGTSPWSNRRIGEPAPETLAERSLRFEAGLSDAAREAYAAWQNADSIDAFILMISEVRKEGLDTQPCMERQKPVREAELRALLTNEQTGEFEELLVAATDRVPDDTFDLRIEQSWVFLRCLDLGWTEERFGDSDGQHSYHRDGNRKTERIGKKYQWIAHYEFLGLLADNFVLRPEWGESESRSYHGPWLDYLRDIDPTCLADGLAHDAAPPWCSLPVYDPDAFGCDDRGWLDVIDDLPDPQSVIQVVDESGEAWLSLEGFHEWRHPPAPGIDEYQVLHRRVWYLLQAYLVETERLDEFMEWSSGQVFMGRWMPENRAFSEVYLREFPESLAFQDLLVDSGEERSGYVTEVRGSDLDIPLIVATDSYSGGSVDRDCSVKESFVIRLPALTLVRAMGLQHGLQDGVWESDNHVVAFDPSVNADSARRLLVRKSVLERHLEEHGFAIVWTMMAAKELSGGWHSGREEYRRTEISGAYALRARKVVGGTWVTGVEPSRAETM